MADGGASSMIMLITALLISGGASAVLIGQWSDVVSVAQREDRASLGEGQVGVALAGDPAMVAYDTTLNTITLYFVNTGEHALETSPYDVRINGDAPTSSSVSVSPSGTVWEPGYLLEVTLTNTSWSGTLNDGDDVSVFFIGLSEPLNSHRHSVTTNAEVRLHVV